MRYWSGFFLGIGLGITLATFVLEMIPGDPPSPVMSEASVTVDASDSLTYRPIRALGDDWYLVEVAYPHVCDNPFPIGKAKMVMVVPHLVRMHASELDKLDNPEK